MGTWDIGIFDSDDSADFLDELKQSEDIHFLQNTLIPVVKKEHYINMTEANRALTASYIVRAIVTGDFSGLPTSIVSWAKSKNSKVYDVLVEISRQAIHNVRTNSELRDLWKTTPDFDRWLEILDDLQRHWSDES